MSSNDWHKQQQEKIRQAQRQAELDRQAGRSGVRQWNTDIHSNEYRQGLREREQCNRPLFPRNAQSARSLFPPAAAGSSQNTQRLLNNARTQSSFDPGYGPGWAPLGKKKSGAGGGVLFVLLVLAGIVYLGTRSSSSSRSTPRTAPSPAAAAKWQGLPDSAISSSPARANGSNKVSAAAQRAEATTAPAASNPVPANQPDDGATLLARAMIAGTPQFSNKIHGTTFSTLLRTEEGDVVYQVKHKGHGGCEGQLVLNASGMRFACAGDSTKNFFVSRGQIEAADEDGVRLFAKDAYGRDAYHFNMGDNASKEDVHALFQAWLDFRGPSAGAAPQ